jgi:hypothetical protein
VLPTTAVVIDLKNYLPTITMTPSGSGKAINFAGTLLTSTNPLGPYQTVSNASSPYLIRATNGQQFFRAGY